MTGLEIIIQQFGFSHQTIAVYLSVSVAQIKMAAIGKRSLPTSALLKLAQLQLAVPIIDSATSAAAVSNIPTCKNGHPLLQVHAKQQTAKAELHRRKLANMQGKHLQAINTLALANELSKQLPKGKEGEKDRLWWELQQEEAGYMIKKHGAEAQIELQWKIDCMAFAAERATTIIKGQ